jgi:hypothetical protein
LPIASVESESSWSFTPSSARTIAESNEIEAGPPPSLSTIQGGPLVHTSSLALDIEYQDSCSMFVVTKGY